MTLPQVTNQEILREMRYEREHNHRINREIFSLRRPLFLSRNSSLSPFENREILFADIQESCNKSTAIYWTPEPGPRSLQIPNGNIIFSVYDQWFRGHDTDIEFGRFVASLIALRTPLGEQGATIQDILTIHRAWCETVAVTLPLFYDQELREWKGDGPFPGSEFNATQHMHYQLQPLFRALIIIYNHSRHYDGKPIVHIIRTGDTTGLSAPIIFENVEPVIDTASGLSSDIPDDDMITTTLSSAIAFVMALESREQNAFIPEGLTDPGTLDEMLGSKAGRDEFACELGYTGPEIQGPSTDWIKLAEGEEMAPPATLQALFARRSAGLGPGQSPYLSCRAKRLHSSPPIF